MALRLVADRVPSWFAIERVSVNEIEGIARPPGTIWWAEGIALRAASRGVPKVYETILGTRLPAYCPDRHIETDGGFCVGLNPPAVRSERGADRWWKELEQYLACQSVASETGLWPLQHALDHGAAGAYHQRALRLAVELGIEQEYLAAYLDAPSWLTSEGVRRFCSPRVRPLHPQHLSRCPRVRRPRRNQVKLMDLVVAEQKRRRALADFWLAERKRGVVCCGCMRDCRLPRKQSSEAIKIGPKIKRGASISPANQFGRPHTLMCSSAVVRAMAA